MRIEGQVECLLDHEIGEVWRALHRLDRYRSWWPFLDRIEAERLRPGATWTCVVDPNMPYRVAFRVEILAVSPPHRVDASIAGDIAGSASIHLEGMASEVTRLRLTSDLTARRRTLRLAGTLAPSVVRRGHDYVIRSGLDRFRERAFVVP